MVLYICKKCNKHFNKKQCYNVHINRKFPCSYEDIIDETNITNICNNKELELEQKNKELKQKNIELEIKIKQLDDKTLILYTQNKEKQELINNKDIEIKNLYKNIKNKDNGDIKIKMIQGYVYIIRECDFVRLNEDIYKIGRTAKINPEDRFQKYRKGTEIVGFFGVKDSIECENKIIKCFSNHINIKKMNEYGKEYFQGDKNILLNEILQIVKHYNIIF